jgi:hypothetical protein
VRPSERGTNTWCDLYEIIFYGEVQKSPTIHCATGIYRTKCTQNKISDMELVMWKRYNSRMASIGYSSPSKKIGGPLGSDKCRPSATSTRRRYLPRVTPWSVRAHTHAVRMHKAVKIAVAALVVLAGPVCGEEGDASAAPASASTASVGIAGYHPVRSGFSARRLCARSHRRLQLEQAFCRPTSPPLFLPDSFNPVGCACRFRT